MRQGRARYQGVSSNDLFYMESKGESEAHVSVSSVQCTDGKAYEVTPDLVKIAPVTVTEHGQ